MTEHIDDVNAKPKAGPHHWKPGESGNPRGMVRGSRHKASLIAEIHAVPAQWLERGFRLLVLRELHTKKEPPAFAWIEQHLLRTPQRLSRHGLSFASAFLPEIMAWLSEHLGRPSLRESTGQPYRNSLWPILTWHGEERLWPDGIHTIEWFVDVVFQDEPSWTAFQQRWHGWLMGESGR